MTTLNGAAIISKLNWRYATKKFDPSKKIADAHWHTLEESLRLSPSSYGLQPWKFLVVQSPEVRAQLTPASWNQPQIETCSHLVVVTHLKTMDEAYVDKYIEKIASVRQIPTESLQGFRDIMVNNAVNGPKKDDIKHWTARQAYIAMGVFMSTAALLDIDVCPMEGINSAQYDQILGLEGSDYTSVSVLAAGYRDPHDASQSQKKVRFDHDDVIRLV